MIGVPLSIGELCMPIKYIWGYSIMVAMKSSATVAQRSIIYSCDPLGTMVKVLNRY